jgi:hypothetical protein
LLKNNIKKGKKMNPESLIFNAILNIAQQEIANKGVDRTVAIENATQAVDLMLTKARELALKYDNSSN